MSTMRVNKHIIIVGAGASGLAMARELRNYNIEDFIMLERKNNFGGLWNYESTTGEDIPIDGITWDQVGAKPVYDKLTTNLSQKMMGFHDFPYEEGIPDVPLMPRTAVTNYFIQFAKHHQLDEYTKFNTIVQKCEKDDGADNWYVSTLSKDGRKTEYLCKYLVVCNGHHSQPILPKLNGMQNFPNRIMHSCSFDRSEEFNGKNILVIGGSVSAGDLAVLMLREKPNKVFMCRRKKPDTMFRKITMGSVNAAIKRGAKMYNSMPLTLKSNGHVIFEKGIEEQIDVIICATGYSYKFDFLNVHKLDLLEDGEFYGYNVKHLYEGIFYSKDPSLSFLGIHK